MSQTAQFDGETYEPSRDHGRLSAQLDRVRELMSDGKGRFLYQISEQTGDPESSCSARLRDLRKAKFGGWQVKREYYSAGLWIYRVTKGSENVAC
jgi:hypothetical protein